jgi:hypothetical protein
LPHRISDRRCAATIPATPRTAPGHYRAGYGEQAPADQTTIISETMLVVGAPADRLARAARRPRRGRRRAGLRALIVLARFDEAAGER